MAKTAQNKAPPTRRVSAGRRAKVKGLGALEGADFRIRKGLDLLKPIAEQAFALEREKLGTK